jgi:superfamily II DNA or RNA helicase
MIKTMNLINYLKHPIVLTTYQIFLSKGGKKLFERIKDKFGMILVDEAHRSNAECFSRVINNLNARYKFGLTATPERKDGREFLAEHILGPVVARPKVKTLKPLVTFVETGTRSTYEHKIWTYALRFLERQAERNKLIVKWVLKDLAAGHSIVIPVVFKSHVKTLVSLINQATGKKTAVPFTGAESKEQRRQVILDARKGKVRVVVGMRSLIQLGINVPRWSCIYEGVMPISNPPNFRQETSRVLTPFDDKPRPLIRFFLDHLGVTRGCLRTCLYQRGLVDMGCEIPKHEWAKVIPYTKRGQIASPKKPLGKQL